MTDTTKAKKKATTSKVKKKETWTISELQMWFRTAIDLQGDDWYPDEEVWGKIVDMVFKLKPDEPARPAQPRPAQPPVQQPAYGGYNPNQHNRSLSPHQELIVGHPIQSDGLSLVPPSTDPIPPGANDIEALRRQSEAGTLNGGKTIKSGQLNQYE